MSDKCGSDGDGDGTEQKPFKTPLRVKELSTLITVLLYYNLPSRQKGEKMVTNICHTKFSCLDLYISLEPILTGSAVCWEGAIPNNLC